MASCGWHENPRNVGQQPEQTGVSEERLGPLGLRRSALASAPLRAGSACPPKTLPCPGGEALGDPGPHRLQASAEAVLVNRMSQTGLSASGRVELDAEGPSARTLHDLESTGRSGPQRRAGGCRSWKSEQHPPSLGTQAPRVRATVSNAGAASPRGPRSAPAGMNSTGAAGDDQRLIVTLRQPARERPDFLTHALDDPLRRLVSGVDQQFAQPL